MGVSCPARRVGVFGGAFDPPHNGHLALVQAALTHLALDELRILPTGQPWHKAARTTPAAHRLAMARLAFGDRPGVVLDERELRRDGPTYTVDTLETLCREQPGVELVLLIGADQARAFGHWHRWADILRLATISVATRDPAVQAFGQKEAESALQGLPGARWQPLPMDSLDISATEIRRRAAAGLPIDHLVPAPVARYIDRHHLYDRTR